MHLYSLIVIKYWCRVYRTTSKYCRIMARGMFWYYTYSSQSCCRDDTVFPKTSGALISPIRIFDRATFLFYPQNWACSMMPHWDDLPAPGVKVSGNSMQSHPNTCNCILDLRLTPKLKGKKEKGASNIGKQSQYCTVDHTDAARLSHLVNRLQIPQLVLLFFPQAST